MERIETIPTMEDLAAAIVKIKDAQLRISRHKSFHHEGMNCNDLV